MNKGNLIEKLTRVLSTKKEAQDAVEALFTEMKKALRAGDKVVISSFGSFHPYVTRSKKGRNPKTGQVIHVAPKKKIRFRQAQDLL